MNSQIEALSERILELPKGVSAEPLDRQLGKLQSLQKDHEEHLLKLKQNGKSSPNRMVATDTFEEFSRQYKKMIAKDLNDLEKKQMVQKFVKKVEVGVKNFKIHFIVDEQHYKRELALKGASYNLKSGCISKLRVFLKDHNSNTLTNGAP